MEGKTEQGLQKDALKFKVRIEVSEVILSVLDELKDAVTIEWIKFEV